MYHYKNNINHFIYQIHIIFFFPYYERKNETKIGYFIIY